MQLYTLYQMQIPVENNPTLLSDHLMIFHFKYNHFVRTSWSVSETKNRLEKLFGRDVRIVDCI